MKSYIFETGTNLQNLDLEEALDANDGDVFSALMEMSSMYSEAAKRCADLAHALQGASVRFDLTDPFEDGLIEVFAEESILGHLVDNVSLFENDEEDDEDDFGYSYDEDKDDGEYMHFSSYSEDDEEDGDDL